MTELQQGLLAGLATSVLWSFTAVFFAAAGRRIGAALVNSLRIMLAIVWLGLTHRVVSGHWLPSASGGQVFYLALSGLIGLSLGDLALFSAFVRIGPRLAMLVMTTAPMFAAGAGVLALGERLHPPAVVGMLLTIAGVAVVVLERPAGGAAAQQQAGRNVGLLLALLATLCQAAGSLLSKQGIGHGWLPREQHLGPLAATFLRMAFAGLFVLPVVAWLVRRGTARDPRPEAAGRRRQGYLFTLGGSLVGPYLGVWMSLVAFDKAPLGVAQTLLSLPPVFVLPLAVWIEKERLTFRAVVGAVVAVAGCALLFLTA